MTDHQQSVGGNAALPASDRGHSRRTLLALFACAPLGLAMVTEAARAQACVNQDTLSAAQKSMRKSLGFRLPSADPKKKCSACAFFTAAGTGCGKCALLSGGIVPADGVCDSWAAKG
ncbi:high-potential iron-sulfur protein [Sphingomonas sp. LaA6.9]|uniref:high-potential iron-sulfur protein n=1 Tax=Sphingomonas sp. LaA6.9 TaxID=2919914 RepID=UPI001F5006DA|nr:high-potential iron-sulfur protein [Sphingomonas sp. LaA6.9]MCJ8159080.1 high-potential iron-sulfur protein [Sphingomonas sp. LaA6.9]